MNVCPSPHPSALFSGNPRGLTEETCFREITGSYCPGPAALGRGGSFSVFTLALFTHGRLDSQAGRLRGRQLPPARGDRFLLPAALLLPQGAPRPLRTEPGSGEWVKLSGERGGPCPFPLAELPPDDRTLPAAGRLSDLPSLKTESCQWILFQGNYCA